MRRQLPKVYRVWQCVEHMQELCKVQSEAVFFEVQTKKLQQAFPANSASICAFKACKLLILQPLNTHR